jgi:hypothetical protein
MGTRKPGGSQVEGIIAVTVDDDRMHLYRDLPELRTSIQSITDGGLEFFDVRGHRLAPNFDPKWTVNGLCPAAAPSEETVRHRLDAVLANLRGTFEQHREELCRVGVIDAGAAPPLPDLAGVALPAAFELLLEAGFGHRPREPEARDVRDFWHNFWAHGLR